jgi:hypothetical protein
MKQANMQINIKKDECALILKWNIKSHNVFNFKIWIPFNSDCKLKPKALTKCEFLPC